MSERPGALSAPYGDLPAEPVDLKPIRRPTACLKWHRLHATKGRLGSKREEQPMPAVSALEPTSDTPSSEPGEAAFHPTTGVPVA